MLRRLTATVRRDPLPHLLGLAIFLLMTGWLAEVYLSMAPDQRLVDLEVYRDAGISVVTGRPVYEWLTASPQLLPFTYPPVAAIFAMPLGLVPLDQLGWLWTAMQMALLLAVVALAYRRFTRRFGRWSPVAVGALSGVLLWALPLRDGIRFGQVDIIIVAMCAADYLIRSPRWPRGLLIGIATAVKLTPGVFIVHLWLAGSRREAATAAGTAVGLTGAAFLFLPGDSADFWFRAILDPDRLGSNIGTSNQSLRGMLMRLGLENGILWLAVVALVGWIGFRIAVRATRRGDNLTALAVVGLLAVLLSPVAWIHHLAWVAVIVAAVLGDGRSVRRFALAVFVWAYFYMKIPWWGQALSTPPNDPDIPIVLARIIQDGFGLMAIVLLFVLDRVSAEAARSEPAPTPVPAYAGASAPAALPAAALPGQLGAERLEAGHDREDREQTAGHPASRR